MQRSPTANVNYTPRWYSAKSQLALSATSGDAGGGGVGEWGGGGGGGTGGGTGLRVLVDFLTESDVRQWRGVNDVVMGGRSTGFLALEEGTGVFRGVVTSAGGGGFSSVRSGCVP